MTRRILVIGGRGYIGEKTSEALRKLDDVEVVVGSRKGHGERELAIDLRKPETFPGLDGFDLIVNCSDSLKADPSAAILYCRTSGLNFFESTFHPATLNSLLQQSTDTRAAHTGRVVLGVGLFPGVSNLLAGAAARARPTCSRLAIGARFSPLSGAGRGMCNLMAALMTQPAYVVRDGKLTELRPVRVGEALRFGHESYQSVGLGFPEALMLQRSQKVAQIDTFLAPRPGFLRLFIYCLIPLFPLIALLRPLFAALTRWALYLVRGVLLRRVPSAVQLTAVADDQTVRSLRISDGQSGTALAIAAMAALFLQSVPDKPGSWLPDQLFGLSPVLERIKQLAGDSLAIERDDSDPGGNDGAV